MDDDTHTGKGRFVWLTMRLMILFELGESNGIISFLKLFNSETKISGINELILGDIFLCCRLVDGLEAFLWIKILL